MKAGGLVRDENCKKFMVPESLDDAFDLPMDSTVVCGMNHFGFCTTEDADIHNLVMDCAARLHVIMANKKTTEVLGTMWRFQELVTLGFGFPWGLPALQAPKERPQKGPM